MPQDKWAVTWYFTGTGNVSIGSLGATLCLLSNTNLSPLLNIRIFFVPSTMGQISDHARLFIHFTYFIFLIICLPFSILLSFNCLPYSIIFVFYKFIHISILSLDYLYRSIYEGTIEPLRSMISFFCLLYIYSYNYSFFFYLWRPIYEGTLQGCKPLRSMFYGFI